MDRALSKQDVNEFFDYLRSTEDMYARWAGELPKNIVVNPELIRRLSKVEGFYQRAELKGEVTVYSPVIRYFKLNLGVVTIVEDYDEKFVHFE